MDSEDEIQSVNRNMEIFVEPLVMGEFASLYVLSTWNEPDTLIPRMTLAIVLSGGIERGGAVFLHVWLYMKWLLSLW